MARANRCTSELAERSMPRMREGGGMVSLNQARLIFHGGVILLLSMLWGLPLFLAVQQGWERTSSGSGGALTSAWLR
jgi:hypothetical protein